MAEYFYKPNIIESHEIFDGLLRGMATQTSQKMDISMIEDVSMRSSSSLVDLTIDFKTIKNKRSKAENLMHKTKSKEQIIRVS